MTREEVIKKFDRAVNACDRFQRKGKTMPYTSANGHMFSQVNKEGQLGIRFSEVDMEAYMEEFQTIAFTSYGATMQGYIVIPEEKLDDIELMKTLLNQGFDYVMSLKAK